MKPTKPMKPKTARRFLNRNQWKLIVHKLSDTGKSLLKREMKCKRIMIKYFKRRDISEEKEIRDGVENRRIFML